MYVSHFRGLRTFSCTNTTNEGPSPIQQQGLDQWFCSPYVLGPSIATKKKKRKNWKNVSSLKYRKNKLQAILCVENFIWLFYVCILANQNSLQINWSVTILKPFIAFVHSSFLKTLAMMECCNASNCTKFRESSLDLSCSWCYARRVLRNKIGVSSALTICLHGTVSVFCFCTKPSLKVRLAILRGASVSALRSLCCAQGEASYKHLMHAWC